MCLQKGGFIKFSIFVLLLCHFFTTVNAAAAKSNESFVGKANVQTFINKMVEKHGYDRQSLITLFRQAKYTPDVVERMNQPYEAKPWYQYQKLMLSDRRTQAGLAFWQKNQAILTNVENQYGVPASIIVAIIGVESNYGNFTGRFPTFDTLSTLAFFYPRREKFFQAELEEYLLMTRENREDPLKITSSYAGAIGLPQFMPSSYRRFAVNYTGSDHIDLWNNSADVIASVANYLKSHGWENNQPIAEPAKVIGKKYKKLPAAKRSAKYSVAQLQQYGIQASATSTSDQKASLVELQDKDKPEFWLGFHNFYVLKRYNASNNYAMAVYQLSNDLNKLQQNA